MSDLRVSPKAGEGEEITGPRRIVVTRIRRVYELVDDVIECRGVDVCVHVDEQPHTVDIKGSQVVQAQISITI